MAAGCGKKAHQKVAKALHEARHGELKCGRTGKTVRSRKQAIAIGPSEARSEGGKVPSASRGRTRSTSRRKTSSRGRMSSS